MSDKAFLESQMDGERDGSITVGDTAPTFDELDSVEIAREEFVEARTADKEPAKEEKKEEKVEAKGEETPEEDAKRVEGDMEKEPTMAPDPEAAAVKMLKLKHGDNELELPADALIPVKIDGKTETFSVSDLVDDFSGKTNWDRKYTDLSNERNQYKEERDQFHQEKEYIYGGLEKFASLAKEGKPLDAVKHLVDFAGGNAHNFHKTLRDQFLPEIQSILEMDEDERKAYFAEEDAKFLKEERESLEQRNQQAAAQKDRELKAYELRETHGVSKEEYVAAERSLKESGLSEVDITPDNVITYHFNDLAVSKAEESIRTVNSNLLEQENAVEIIREVALMHRDDGLSEEQVQEAIREAFGNRKEIEALNEKVKQSKPVTKDLKTKESKESVEMFSDWENDGDNYYNDVY